MKFLDLFVSLSLTLVLNLQSARGQSQNSKSCNYTCEKNDENTWELDTNLKYEAGKIYSYTFNTKVVTTIVGTTDENVGTQLSGKMLLSATNNSCDVTITLRNVTMAMRSTDDQKSEDLEGSSLRFFWNRQNIQGVCLDPAESTWSANVKRALASLFVNAGSNIRSEGQHTEWTESDSSASECSTTYERNGEIYTKTRDFSTCMDSGREGGSFVKLGIPYKSYDRQHAQTFKSEQKCIQNFTSGLLQSVHCKETHQLTPFSSGNSGGQTKVEVTLTLDEILDGAELETEALSMRTDISFDHSETEQPSNIEEIKRAYAALWGIPEVCAALKRNPLAQGMSSMELRLQSNLKKSMRWAKAADLIQVAQNIKNDNCLEAFVDAAIMAATGETIKFAIRINNGQIPQKNVRMFTIQSVFAERVDAGTIAAMTELISNASVDPQLLLAASSLAHKFDKYSTPEVIALVNEISNHVKSSDQNEQRTIVALQALGNLNNFTDKATDAILWGLQSSQARVKLNALQAFRRNPCQRDLRNASRELLGNASEPADVRIAAYLAFVACTNSESTYEDANFISNVLTAGSSTHLSTFIKSHFANQRANKLPSREWFPFFINIPDHIRPHNSLKMSKNFLFSDNGKESGIGRLIEGNVIYSAESFVPRTLSGNMVIDFNQRSYQIVEAGINFNGLEKILAKYFGPGGKYENINIFQPNLFNFNLRAKRSVDSDQNLLKNLLEKFHSLPQGTKNEENLFTSDAHFRIFGTTVRVDFYDSFQFMEENTSILNYFGKGIFEKDFAWNQFLPLPTYESVIPTVAGFPLKFALEANTNFFFDFKKQKDGEMKARASSSGNFNGIMSVSTGPGMESGIEFDTNLNLARALEIKSSMTEETKTSNDWTQPWSFKFGLPMDKDQVAEITNNIYWVERLSNGKVFKEKVNELKSPEMDSNWCSKSLLKATGFNFCTKFKLPRVTKTMPWFPLDGNTVMKAELTKSEPGIEGFFVKVKSTGLKGKFPSKSGHLSIMVDTPGSTKDLRTDVTIDVKSEYGNSNSTRVMSLDLNLDSWWQKDFKLQVKSSETPTMKTFEILAINNGKTHGLKGQSFSSHFKFNDRARKYFKMSTTNDYELSMIGPSGSSSLLSGKISNEFENESENEIETDLPNSGDLTFAANIPKFYLEGNVTGKWERSPDLNSPDGDTNIFLELNFTNMEGKTKNFENIALKGFANISHTFKNSSLWFDVKYGKESEPKKDLSFRGKYDFKKSWMPLIETKMESSAVPSLNFEGKLNVIDGGDREKNITLLISHKSSQVYWSDNVTINRFQVKRVANASIPLCGDVVYLTSVCVYLNEHGQYLSNFTLRTKNLSTKFAYYDVKIDPKTEYEISTKVDYQNKITTFYSKLNQTNATAWNLEFAAIRQTELKDGSWNYNMDAVLNAESYQNWGAVATLNSNRISKPILIQCGFDYPPYEWNSNKSRQSYIRVSQPNDPIFNISVQELMNSSLHYAAKSSLRNLYDYDLTLTSEKKKNFWLDNIILNWHLDWLPTGRKFVHRLEWDATRSELMNNVNETEYRLAGQFSWDARKDSTKNLQYGFFVTREETENDTDTRTFRTKFESQGSKVATMSRYFPRQDSWLWEKRWVTNFGLDYTNPQNQSYHLGIETFPANEEDSTLTGKIKFTTQGRGEEMKEFPMEIIYSSEDGNGYDVKFLYQSGYLDKFGQKYPLFPVHFRYRNENNIKLGTAWVPTTGELLFLASETGNSHYDDEYSVTEFWIAGMNYSLIGHSGRRADKDKKPTGNFWKLMKSTASNISTPKKYTEILASTDYEDGMISLPLISYDSIGSHLLTNYGVDMRSLYSIYVKFNWENETIQKYLNDFKFDAQKVETGMEKILTKVWNDLSKNETELLARFNFSALFDRINESRPDNLSSIISNDVLKSVDGVSFVNSEIETPVSTYPIINSAMKGFTAILDGIGSFFNYMSTSTPTTKSENSTTISTSVENTYQKIEKRFKPVVETLDAINKFVNLEFSTSTTFGFIINRIGRFGQFFNRLFFGECEILRKWNSFGKKLEADLRRSFPFNETTEFIKVFKEYSNLEENEDEHKNKTIEFKTVVSKFGKLVDKGWDELYKADYEKGVITSRVPILIFVSGWAQFRYFDPLGASKTYESKFLLRNISTQLTNLFKPTDAYAVLLGPNFITFDTQDGNISSECKYLLAAELKEQRFSISAQFKYDNAKKTYSASDIYLTTKNLPESFHLDRNSYAAKINGVKTNPFTQWARIEDPKDKVEIICSNGYSKSNLDICVIKISGYYHGNVMGLLGMFNNEGADDFIMPSGSLSTHPTDFDDTWITDPNCINSHDEGAVAESANYDDICRQFTNKLDEGQVSPNCPISPAYKKICEIREWKNYETDSSSEY